MRRITRLSSSLAVLRWVLTRYGIFFVLLAGLLWVMGFSSVIGKVRASALSRLMPDYTYLREFESGQSEYDARKIDEYLHYYRKLVSYLPLRPEARAILGYLSAKLGDQDEALLQFRIGTQLNPRVFSFYYNTAVLLMRSGHYRQAAEFFQRALDTDLKENLSFMTSSRILYPLFPQGGDLSEVVRTRIKSNFGKGYKGLLLSQYLDGLNAAAITTAALALSSSVPDAPFFTFYAGLCSYQIKNYPQAIGFFQECLKRDPDHAEAVYYLAQVMQALGRPHAAREFMQRAASLHEIRPDISPLDSIDLILF